MGVVSFQPHCLCLSVCVCVCLCVCVCVPAPGICLLSLSPTALGLHATRLWCLPVKDVTQRQAEGMFFPRSHHFQKTRRGGLSHRGSLDDVAAGPHPGRVVHDPRVGEGRLLPWWPV